MKLISSDGVGVYSTGWSPPTASKVAGSGIENKRVTGKTFIRFRGPQALIGQGRVTARAFGPNQ